MSASAPRRPAPPSKAGLAFSFGFGFCFGLSALAASAQEATLPTGRWSVRSRGLDWPCRLEALEVRETTRAGDASVVAFERGPDGVERTWGTSRIDRRAVGPPASRWFSATWAAGGSTVVLQLRPDGPGRVLAIVRERPDDRGGGERVRQAILAPSDRAGATAAGGSVRFEPDSSNPRAEQAGVFVAGVDGHDPRLVAAPDGFARAASPAWSPDGRRLAFAGFDASGRSPLIRVVPAGGGPTLALAAGSNPTWSSDGNRLAYVASGRPDYATDWSSPGRNDERIEAVTLAGPHAGEVEVLARGIWPRWSPSDGRLAFVARRDANWDVHVRSADGLDQVRLTTDPALDTQPTWSADGHSIVFLSDRGNRWDLYRAPLDRPGLAIPLTNHARREETASISTDGRHVAFLDNRGRSDASIQLLDLDRGTVRPFPDHPDGDRDPAFSPDGRAIAFVSRRPGRP